MIPPKALVVLGTSPGLLLPCLAQWMGGRSVLRNLGLSPSSCALDQQKASFVKQVVGLIDFWYCLTRWTNIRNIFEKVSKSKFGHVFWTWWRNVLKFPCQINMSFVFGWVGTWGICWGEGFCRGDLRFVAMSLALPCDKSTLAAAMAEEARREDQYVFLCHFSVVRWFGMQCIPTLLLKEQIRRTT